MHKIHHIYIHVPIKVKKGKRRKNNGARGKFRTHNIAIHPQSCKKQVIHSSINDMIEGVVKRPKVKHQNGYIVTN